MKTIVISRELDQNRRARVQEHIPSSLDWEFLDATDGHRPTSIGARYAELVPRQFWEDRKIKPGAFGCFVSHYRAWLNCVQRNTDVFVLEDDILFRGGGNVIAELPKVHEWEVIFVNRTAVAWNLLYQAYRDAAFIPIPTLRRKFALRASRASSKKMGGAGREVTSLRDVVCSLVRWGVIPDNYDTPGACGYILTPTGARKLLTVADSLGTVVGVDWFMLGSAVSGAVPSGAWQLPMKVAKYFLNAPRVNVGVANRWVVDSIDDDVGGSVINHSQMVSIDEYASLIRQNPE